MTWDAIQKPCSGCTSQLQRPDALGLSTISLSAHTDLFEVLTSGLEQEEQVELAASEVAVGRLLTTPGLITQVHSVPEGSVSGGGVLVTAATSTGSRAVIKAVGSIGGLYHAFTVRFFIDQEARAVRVQLSSDHPVQLDYTWHFAFRDVVALPDGRFMASSVELDAAKMAAAPRIDIDAGCIALCGASPIISILFGCLPLLIFTPPVYLGCVLAATGGFLSAVVCVITRCLGGGGGGGGGHPPPPHGHID